jgi:hypothetical protein
MGDALLHGATFYHSYHSAGTPFLLSNSRTNWQNAAITSRLFRDAYHIMGGRAPSTTSSDPGSERSRKAALLAVLLAVTQAANAAGFLREQAIRGGT